MPERSVRVSHAFVKERILLLQTVHSPGLKVHREARVLRASRKRLKLESMGLKVIIML